ncbi:hypothetical protein OAB01_01600 [Bacteroidia bacterium]|nr:hypothetical protein [Bacteroidia bacterium]
MKALKMIALTGVALGLVYWTGCKKETKRVTRETNTKEVELAHDAIFQIMPDGNGGFGGKNYCSDCGSSTDPKWACVSERFADGSAQSICGKVEKGACGVMHLNKKLDDLAFPNAPLDTNIIHGYRDTVLINSPKGQTYITFFYDISFVIIDYGTITTLNFLQHYNFAQKVADAAETLQNGQNTDIVIDAQFKTDAMSLINYYRTVELDHVFQDKLDLIEADLTIFENKTRSEVLTILNLVDQ